MASQETSGDKQIINKPGDPVYDMQHPRIQRLVADIRQARENPVRLMGISRSYRRGVL